ncbi:hypothetical protein FJT64_020163 [Amphibalanus amphitrite]|uniref:Uncharacterized protein n=1 Tax=Amphibalanus amphitrite TaxID=1232801 RepID=A0A6A4WXT1_AMPAM|nr:hypothetical protein FJT64_008714 [Amphibalanus amphitrite]KAF0308624.1 hypothetical protein FJT64_020163 [Amphibalanus amphitrite]
MASVEQLLLAALWTPLAAALSTRPDSAPSQPSSPPPASNSSADAGAPRVEAARETHMAAAAAAGASASHPLLTLTLVLALCFVSAAAAFGLRRVLRRAFFKDRAGSYRYFKVNQEDDGELMAVDGGYHVALDDSSEDEVGQEWGKIDGG